MMTKSGAVIDAVNRYWQGGVNNGLIIVDAVVLCACIVDCLRFAGSGSSFASVLRVASEATVKGESLVVALAVLTFFIIAIPMVMALLSAFLAPRGLWPQYLTRTSQRVVGFHLLLSVLFAIFTISAITMELLSGYAKDEHSVKYNFGSIWLGCVFLGKPVYVAYISPIIRKFVVRFTADPTHAGHTLKEVVKEIGTEESIGGQ